MLQEEIHLITLGAIHNTVKKFLESYCGSNPTTKETTLYAIEETLKYVGGEETQVRGNIETQIELEEKWREEACKDDMF